MNKTFLTISALAALALSACATTPAEPGKYQELARCLTEKGVIMYGASWCPHCQNQKKMFGGDWQFVTSQECDQNSPGGDRQKCLAAGVTSYPTWKIPGSEPLLGEQTFFTLAKEANCLDKLPKEELPEGTVTTPATTTETTEPTVTNPEVTTKTESANTPKIEIEALPLPPIEERVITPAPDLTE